LICPNTGAGNGGKHERDGAEALSDALGGLPLAHEMAAVVQESYDEVNNFRYCEADAIELPPQDSEFKHGLVQTLGAAALYSRMGPGNQRESQQYLYEARLMDVDQP
jgi:hypothetical protein